MPFRLSVRAENTPNVTTYRSSAVRPRRRRKKFGVGRWRCPLEELLPHPAGISRENRIGVAGVLVPGADQDFVLELGLAPLRAAEKNSQLGRLFRFVDEILDQTRIERDVHVAKDVDSVRGSGWRTENCTAILSVDRSAEIRGRVLFFQLLRAREKLCKFHLRWFVYD